MNIIKIKEQDGAGASLKTLVSFEDLLFCSVRGHYDSEGKMSGGAYCSLQIVGEGDTVSALP